MSSDKISQKTSVAERLATALIEKAYNVIVADVRIGLAYTAVQLENGSTGVALTFHNEARGCCAVRKDLHPIRGRVASDLLPMLLSTDPIEAAVGLACANAHANHQQEGFQEGDILDILELDSNDHVGMIGHFGPLVEPVQNRVKSLMIFERVEEKNGILHPAREATIHLPKCHVALITATSILNRTIDDLLTASRNCRVVAVLGASTPMLPEVFSDTAVNILSGVVVSDTMSLLRTVSEGGGMRLFRPYVRKVNIDIAKH